jgi:hypothetical protein
VAASTGDIINDLSGPFGHASIAAGAGPAGTLDYFWGTGTQGQAVTGMGVTIGLGGGASSAIQVTETVIAGQVNIPSLLGGGGAGPDVPVLGGQK